MRNYPEAFLEECRNLLSKEEYPLFRRAMQQPSLHALRLNPLRENGLKAASLYTLSQNRVPWEENGYYVSEALRAGADIRHAAGAYYMQDASAMAAVAALSPQSGECVLDLCAAPGGKSGQIAGRMMGKGFLLSNEIDFSRARILLSNLERLGAVNAYVTSASADILCKALPQFFDAVLVDAPCSGEGMFRRDENAVNEWTSASPQGCAKRQAEILSFAAETVKIGGRLVYSTCAFNHFENEEIIGGFLKTHPDFEADSFALNGVGESENGCLRLWPHRINGEGHFVARLRRVGGESAREIPLVKPQKNSAQLAAELKEFAKTLPEGVILERENELSLFSAQAPDLQALKGARVLRGGLSLATRQKGRLLPEHALAMALSPETAAQALELDETQAAQYLAGEEISVSESANGWALATFQGLPLGWGKASQGKLKNHLPKGLRKRGGHEIKVIPHK